MDEFVHVNIVRSSTKAHLIEDSAGRQAWIPKNRLRKDGTVNAKFFDLQVAEKISRDKAAAEDPNREFLDSCHPINPKKEEDRRIAVMASWTGSLGQGGRHLVWFPKSMVNDGKLPGWLIKSKAEEVAGQLVSLIRMPIKEIEIEIEIAGYKF